MPIYEYRCDDCGALYEVFQKISDDPLETCEQCGASVRRVLHPVAIHFKGSGFYTTDYGKGTSRRSGAAEQTSGDGTEAEKASGGGADKGSAADAGKGSPGGTGSTNGGSSGEAGGKAKEKQTAS